MFLYFNEANRTCYTFLIQFINCWKKARFLTRILSAFFFFFFAKLYSVYHVDMRWITSCICRFNHQNNEFPGETKLPPGLWGCNQQADQSGTVCLLCLPVYGESNLDGCTNSSDRWSVFELWWYGFRFVCSCHKTKVQVPSELCRLLSREVIMRPGKTCPYCLLA